MKRKGKVVGLVAILSLLSSTILRFVGIDDGYYLNEVGWIVAMLCWMGFFDND